MKRIPVIDAPRQSMLFTSDGRIKIELDWNTVARAWFIDFHRNDVIRLQGHKLVSNVNLLNEGALICVDASDGDRDPDYDNLISGNVRLYYYSADEFETLQP